MDFKTIAGSAARLLAGMVAAWFIRKGLLEEGDSNGFVEIVSGVVVALGVFAWSLFQKWFDKKIAKEQVVVGVSMPVTATVAQVEEKHAELRAAGAFAGPNPEIQVK